MDHGQTQKLLNVKETSWNFDLSDIKNDKTQYLDKTSHLKSTPNSPFEPKEISARSTHIKSKFGNLDFDEIMKSSTSEAIKNKYCVYRESISAGRVSNLPKSVSKTFHPSASKRYNNDNSRMTSTSVRKDFWDEANPSFSSFTGKNGTYLNEEFIPAEDMAEKLDEDERMQEMEYALIPRNNKPAEETLNWENHISRQPEMSFGQYCVDKIKPVNIREIYGNASPPKRQDRVALVEITENNESTFGDSDLFKTRNIDKLIKNFDPTKIDLLLKKNRKVEMQKNSNIYSGSVEEIMQELDVDRMVELAERERNRTRLDKENEDHCIPEHETLDDLQRYRNELQLPNRGVKRKTSLAPTDTPKSALDKCHRSRSPTNRKEMEQAAARLKPKVIDDSDLFKKPSDSTILKNYTKSPSRILIVEPEQQTSREYLSAMQSLSLRSPNEKLSLPNYSLQRSDKSSTLTSPTSSIRSVNSQWSPKLRRSASQMSTDSEFNDDFLPIKIKNIDNRKLSFPSVKIDKFVTKSITIQNGSNKKLPLRVKIIGAGFSVSPQEEFRMVPLEARTFNVKFTPSAVGPARGGLIFELITNKQCSKTIPLFAYGGHSNISIENIQKGPFGPAFITMGTIKDLTMLIEKKINFVNKGTLPGFVSLAFERTKLSDFVLSNSISVDPAQLKIDPGKSADVKIRFKATKSEIRKIISFNKDVTTIAEICVISGDEPTRLRILKNHHFVEPKFLDYLPKSFPNEDEIQMKLQKFNESLTRDKLSTIMSEIRTHEIALTINRNLEDSIILSTEMSLVDDTHMSFKTFVDQTNIPNVMDTLCDIEDEDDEDESCLESKYFRITPAELYFERSTDNHESVKVIKVQSLCNELLYVEAVPSNFKVISALKPNGKLNPRETIEIQVMPTQRAIENRNCLNASIVIVIRNARIDIPVKIVD